MLHRLHGVMAEMVRLGSEKGLTEFSQTQLANYSPNVLC